jgi:transitional endoplasmic reticulum ATPase
VAEAAVATPKTEEEIHEAIRTKLGEVNALRNERSDLTSIVYQGNQFAFPVSYQHDPAAGVQALVEIIAELETKTDFTFDFNFRPWDGAVALRSVLMKNWGTGGHAQMMRSFFGTSSPKVHPVTVGPNGQKISVPWGVLHFAPFDATITLDSTMHPDYGQIFRITVNAAKKYEGALNELARMVEQELAEHSIYRGKAFTGSDDPTFIDPYLVDRNLVVYSKEVQVDLTANIWSMIRHTSKAEGNKLSLKRSVLLAGPYGTGKSMAAMITAQEAVENGWTFIQCRSGKDNLEKTLQTAKLYQPSIVFYEDVDNLIDDDGDTRQISDLLNLVDGITSKGVALGMVLTSNDPDRILEAMRRPGRVDSLITIAELDREGVIKLIKVLVDENSENQLAPDFNFDAVADAMEGFLPAFVRETIDRTKWYALGRSGDVALLTTDDFLYSANAVRRQLDWMHQAKTVTPDTLSSAMKRTMHEVITSGDVVVESDGRKTILTSGS